MDELFFLLERLYQMTSIPVQVFHGSDDDILFTRGYGHESKQHNISDFKKGLLRKAKRASHPFLKLNEGPYAYGIMTDPIGCVIIFGPMKLAPMSDQELCIYVKRHNIKQRDFAMAPGPLLILSSMLAILYYARTGKLISETDIGTSDTYDALLLNDNAISSYMMQNIEKDIVRFDYRTELLYLKQIRTGDVEGIGKEADPHFNLSSVGQMARTSLKHAEYMVCASITLAARAAIDGGLSPTTAYAISDLYLQQLELCKTVDEILSIHLEMNMTYAKQVQKTRDIRCKTSYVEKCKYFISNHLNKPFTLDELAQALQINKSYLSRKFKEELGMSIMKYTRMQRIEAASNMLKYSDEDIVVIANYLCFPSQSHFGAVFKEQKGITPQKYRHREQVI